MNPDECPKRRGRSNDRKKSRKRRRTNGTSTSLTPMSSVQSGGGSLEADTTSGQERREENTMEEQCGANSCAAKPLSGVLVAVSSLIVESTSNPSATAAASCPVRGESSMATSSKCGNTGQHHDDPDDNKDNNNDSLLTYNALIRLCQSAGARTTPQVHRRVQVVVATPAAAAAAAANGTQRVRKARKLSIPVVSPGWVRLCVQRKHRVDWTAFAYRAESTSAAAAARTRPCRNVEAVPRCDSDLRSGLLVEEARIIDLGCCCVCHESESPADCPWCVDCAVSDREKKC